MSKKCWYCGKPATVTPARKTEDALGNKYPVHNCRWFCEDCEIELMIERAIRSLEHQDIEIYDYKDAIDAVSGFVKDNPTKVDSADEIIAAIILVSNEVKCSLQAKVGNYRVDFMLPKIKTILEIDGERHADRIFYDNARDKEIRKILGEDWEIVHIKTAYIQQNAEMLYEAILQIRTQKQLLRAKYNGELPALYHEKGKKPPKKDYGDELLLD